MNNIFNSRKNISIRKTFVFYMSLDLKLWVLQINIVLEMHNGLNITHSNLIGKMKKRL